MKIRLFIFTLVDVFAWSFIVLAIPMLIVIVGVLFHQFIHWVDGVSLH